MVFSLLWSLFPAHAQDDDAAVEVERFQLTCPSSAVEGSTFQCTISDTGVGTASWPVVGILHLSSDADRALVRGVPVDAALQAPADGAAVDGGLWWIGDVLVGYSRADLVGESEGDGDTRTVSIGVLDDEEYELAERFYVALAEDGRRGVGALYLNRQAIEIAASDTRSTDAWLTDLQVSAAGAELQLDFSRMTTSYVASVAYEAAEAVVMPTASHGRATIAVQGVPAESGEGSAGVALGVGSTRVETVVTAEDGSSRTYVIDVTRAPRGENVKVRADGFTLTCPAAVDEGTDVSCTLANGSGGSADWPVVAILHSSVDGNRALIAEDPLITVSSPAFATDVGLAAEQTPARSGYNFGYGELFSGESRSAYTTYGYEKFDWPGAAADEEQRSVVIGVSADEQVEEEETFYVALAPSGYTGLSDLVDNKVPLVVQDASGEAPGAPAAVAVVTGDGELTVSWVAPTADGGKPVTGYVVQWKADGEDYDATREALAASSPHTVEGLQNGTEYTVRVVAVNAVGRSESSAEASGTPSGPKASSDATLSALSLSGIDIETFAGGTTAYAASVGHDVTSTTVTAAANDAGASVTIADADGSTTDAARTVALAVGENAITVTVTAADGETTMTYAVSVTRAASSDATLSALSLSGTDIGTFAGGTTAYAASVGQDVTSTTVTATANDAGASVTIADADGSTTDAARTVALAVGENAITVTVTAADGETTATYTVAVTRAAVAGGEPPNVVLILVDDLGFSDIGAYGSEIETPNIDALARDGLRFSQFYNMAKCEMTRASLFTGLFVEKRHADNAQALPTLLGGAGYHTIMVGKEHFRGWAARRLLGRSLFDEALTFSVLVPYLVPDDGAWERPFMLNGREMQPGELEVDRQPFHKTDAMTDYALRFLEQAQANDEPFFLYLPYHAPHYPLQAREEDIARYRDAYRVGWDAIRAERFRRLQAGGLLPAGVRLSPPEGNVNRFRQPYPAATGAYRPWAGLEAAEQEALALEMAVYAAMVDRLDRNIGRVLDKLDALGVSDDTLVLFLSDNGSSPYDSNEDVSVPPGGADSFRTLSAAWANVGNTPFRYFKQFGHEGGTRAPFIARWPGRVDPGMTDQPAHVADLLPTLLELAGTSYPPSADGAATPTLDGDSLVPVLDGGTRSPPELLLGGYTERFRMVRMEDWKIVRTNGEPWQLYNLATDPTELLDRATNEPAQLESLVARYDEWIDLHGAVLPRSGEVAEADAAGIADDRDVAALASLELEGVDIGTFDADTVVYAATVDPDTERTTVDAVAEAAGATVAIVPADANADATDGHQVALAAGATTGIVVGVGVGSKARAYVIDVMRPASADATLRGLSLTGIGIGAFDGATTAYTAAVGHEVTTTTVTATATDASASVTIADAHGSTTDGPRTVSLAVGGNTITVTVKAAEGATTKAYTVAVTRAASNDATLRALTLSGLDIGTFDAATTAYAAAAAEVVAATTVTATPNDAGATVVITDGNGSMSGTARDVALSYGANAITMTVTAADGQTTKTYTVTVTRAYTPPTATITAETSAVTEGASASFAVRLDKAAKDALSVAVTVAETGGMLTATESSVVIAAGDTAATLELGTVDDNVVEEASTVTATLAAGDGYTVGTTDSAEVSVADDDAATFAVAASPGTINEGGASTVTVSITNGVVFAADQTVTLAGSGTAAADDYTLSRTSLTLAAGDATVSATVTATDDEAEELAETVTLTAVHGGTEVGAATVTIVANDGPDDATLAMLALSGVAFDFRSEIEEYAVNAGQLESTTITATPSDADASVVVDPVDEDADAGNGHQVRLSVGENVVAARVTSEDEQTTKTYTVRVTRTELDAAVSLRRADRDFDGLAANVPFGLWSDGTTLWVATWWGGGVLAFDLGGGGRTGDRDIETASDNGSPVGLWSDGETLWAAEHGGGIYAYRLSDGERVSAEDLGPTMTAAGNEAPTGLWSDGSTLWVADRSDAHVYAFRLSDKTRDEEREFGLDEGTRAYGLWSDGTTMWVTDFTGGRVAAYALTDGSRDEGRDYDTSQVGNGSPTGLWSDGATLWVGDRYDDQKLYAYALFGATEPAASADATLGRLSLSGVDIGEFDSATTGYAVEVANGVSSTTVTASPTNPAASVTIADSDGSAAGTTRLVSLAVGRTDIAVTVTAADGATTATYTVAVTRAASSDATLSALSLSGIDIGPFEAATLNYAASVGHQVSSTTVNAVAADASASVTIGDADGSSEGTSRAVLLSVGRNEVSVSVIAGDGQTTAEYTVAVTRAAPPPSDDATLSGLSLTGVDIGTFDSGTTSYGASVGQDVTSTTVTATANDAGASVTIAEADGSTTDAARTVALAVGENAITVTVTAADGETTMTYGVSVTRAASSDATLSALSLSGIDIGTFAGGTTAYAASVGQDVTSTTVTATANDAGASVTIADADGSTTDAARTVALAVGENAITVTVTAADDETTATYTVSVTRAGGPLVAAFEDIPAEHYGSLEFELGLRFSEEFPLSYRTLKGALKVDAGVLGSVRRTTPGSNLGWRIKVRPRTVRDVTVTLPGGLACDAEDAICTADGRVLSNSPTATLPGPDFRIAADAAAVPEGTPASFTVTRAGAAELGMEVALRVKESGRVLRDAPPGSVVFGVGENSVAVSLATDDDAVSEGDSTVTATLDMRPARESAAVTVLDDDEATFALAAQPAEIEEGASSTVTVTVADGVTFAKRQTLSLSAMGTADAGDYALEPTTLVLAAGAGSAAATLTAMDDGAKEDDETVIVSAALGGETVGETTVTIAANDAEASDDATLAALSLSGVDIGAFDKATTEYAASVEHDVGSTTVTATPSDAGAEVRVSDASGATVGTTRTTRLAEGANAIGVRVSAEDRIATADYGVTVTREAAPEVAWGVRQPTRDIDLSAADWPRGLWSDGETLWAGDWDNGTVLAYALEDGSRLAEKDFTLGLFLAAALWSDGETLWAANFEGGVHAYGLADGERLTEEDLDADAMAAAGNDAPAGLWSDGDTMWVADHSDAWVYAYGLSDGSRREAREFTLRTADDDAVRVIRPLGLYSDGETVLATDWNRGTVRGYALDGARRAERDVDESATANGHAAGLWSDGRTLWVVDETEQKAFAYAATELRDPDPMRQSLIGDLRSRASAVPGGAAAGAAVAIPDPGLRARVLVALGKGPDDTVGARELAALEVLDARDAGVESLVGLEHAVNLEGIDLGHNAVADLRPLASLAGLRRLNLDGAAPDLWGVSGLTTLTGLSVRGNGIEDLGALAGLTRLERLDVADNRVVELAPVAGMVHLGALRLDDNSVDDLSALAGLDNLRYLSLRGNAVTDVRPLARLAQLRRLVLRDNRVEDLSPLAGGVDALRLLDVRGNGIADFSALDGRGGLRVIGERASRDAR